MENKHNHTYSILALLKGILSIGLVFLILIQPLSYLTSQIIDIEYEIFEAIGESPDSEEEKDTSEGEDEEEDFYFFYDLHSKSVCEQHVFCSLLHKKLLGIHVSIPLPPPERI